MKDEELFINGGRMRASHLRLEAGNLIFQRAKLIQEERGITLRESQVVAIKELQQFLDDTRHHYEKDIEFLKLCGRI